MSGIVATVKQIRDVLEVHVPVPRMEYLNNVMRSNSFEELWTLYKAAGEPVKEMTESYSAHRHLRRWRHRAATVVHVGDGARCLTAALFAFLTTHHNIAIDPAINEAQVGVWQTRWGVERFDHFKGRIEDYPLEELEGPLLFTFVHAHVDTDRVLSRVPGKWLAAYSLACCEPKQQLGTADVTLDAGDDWNVLSPQRRYRLIVPARETEVR